MHGHEGHSERRRTDRLVEEFLDLHARTARFTDGLREARCRREDHFGRRMNESLGVLEPLMGAWNLEILFRLSMDGPLRFGALRRALRDVSSRVLTDKLRDLEGHGFVAHPAPGAPYALTPRGEAAARHLHPLVFYLRNAEAISPLVARASPALDI